MKAIKDFTDLEVWHLAKNLAIKIYKLLETFPAEERFGLIAQIKDAVISISGNIAEGFGRFHFNDRIKFYFNSRGSLLEVKSHLLVSETLGFINQKNQQLYEEIMNDIEILGVKINNYISTIRKFSLKTTNKQ